MKTRLAACLCFAVVSFASTSVLADNTAIDGMGTGALNGNRGANGKYPPATNGNAPASVPEPGGLALAATALLAALAASRRTRRA